MSIGDVADLNWPATKMLPVFQAPQHLAVYDIQQASHDIQLAVTTLVGLINRPQPQVYLITGSDDAFWLKHIPDALTDGKVLASGDAVLDALLRAYPRSVQGMIIFDPALPDSINVATTMAGVRNALVVSPPLAQSVQHAHQLSILADLRTFQWRTRLQAYHWAQQNLLNDCSTRLLAGLHPDNVTGLRSFAVATRTFVYYLDSRRYLPDLSEGLLSERNLMDQIITSFPQGGTHLGWFIDESSGVNLTSQAAMAVLATDAFLNLEVWTAVQSASTAAVVPIKRQTTPTEKKVYVSFTISDGDNLQYSQHRMVQRWDHASKRTFPIGWTISPVLREAAPVLAAYYQRTIKPIDEFIAGPSGAGYMFPSHWPAAQLLPFLQRTGQQMQAMNLSLIEVLDTDFWQSSGLPIISLIRQTGMVFTDARSQQEYVQVLRPYGLQGVLSGAGLNKVGWQKVDGVPFYQNLGLAGSVQKTIRLIQNAAAANPQRPFFLNVYVLTWSMAPSDLQHVVQQLGEGYEIVLPSVLLTKLAETIA